MLHPSQLIMSMVVFSYNDNYLILFNINNSRLLKTKVFLLFEFYIFVIVDGNRLLYIIKKIVDAQYFNITF